MERVEEYLVDEEGWGLYYPLVLLINMDGTSVQAVAIAQAFG